MSALGSLVVKLALEYAQYTQGINKSEQDALRFAKNVQDGMDAAKRATGEFLGGVVSGALAAVASYQTVTAVVTNVRAAIDRLDALNDLSERLGISSKALQELGYAGAFADASLEGIGKGAQKLAQFMTEVAGGGKEQIKLFKLLGVEAQNADGSLRDVADVMVDVADVFAGMEDGAAKTALALKLFGKQGVELIPLLNTGADGIKRAREEAQAFGIVVSEEAVKAAAEFNDNMDRLGKVMEGTWNQVSSAALPVLVEFTNAAVAAATGTGSLNDEAQRLARDGTLTEWTRSVVTGLTYVMDAAEGAWRVIKAGAQVVGGVMAYAMTNVAGLSEAFGRVVRGDFAGAYAALTTNGTKLKTVLGALGDDLGVTFGESTFGAKIRARMGDLGKFGSAAEDAGKKSKASAELIAAIGGNAEKAAKEVDKAAKAYEGWSEKLAAYNVELDAQFKQTEKLSKAEAWLAELQANATDNVKALTDANRQALVVETQLVIAKEKRNKAQQDEEKWMLESAAANQKVIEAAQQQATAYGNELAALEEEHARLGMNTEQLARREAAKLRDVAATKLMLASMLPETEEGARLAAAYELQAQRLFEIANAKLALAQDQTFLDAQKAEAEELQRTYDQIGQGLANALMQGGKSAWEYIKGLFRTMVLQPTLQAAIQPLIGEVAGALGVGGGGGSSLQQGASMLSTLYGAGSKAYGWLTGAGTAAASTTTTTAVAAKATNAALIESAVGTSGYGASSAGAGGAAGGASSAAWAGWVALAVVAAMRANSDWKAGFRRDQARDVSDNLFGSSALGDFGAGGGIESAKANFLSKLGFSDRMADLLSGATAVAALLGRAAPRVESQGVSGTFSGGAFQGQAYADIIEKGGLFRSDKRYTETAAVGEELGRFLSGAASSIQSKAKEYGEALGLPVASLSSVQKDIKLALTDDAEANQTALMEALGGYGDALVAGWADALKPLANYGETTAETLDRVGASLSSVNDALAILGKSALQASVAGGAAALDLEALFGSLDAMSNAVGTYYNKFYTQEERTAALRGKLTEDFAAWGAVLPKTRAEFRGMVDAQDLSTASGREAFAALVSISDAFDTLITAEEELSEATRQLADDAAEAARELAEAVRSGLSSVIGDFISGEALADFRAGEIGSTLAGAGIASSIEGILGATKEDIVALWNSVGDEGRSAILEAYGAWKELQELIIQTDMAALVEGTGSSVDDVLDAYGELVPAADGLVDSWRKNKTAMEELRDALAEIDGKPLLSDLEKLRDAVGRRDALQGVVTNNAATIGSLIMGRRDASSLRYAQGREADLMARYKSDPTAKNASELTTATLDRIKLQGELEGAASKARIDALKEEISAAERLREVASQMGDFVLSLKAGSLSNLSYGGRLDAQRQLFDKAIATGGDVQGQAQSYLQSAQQIFGGSTAQYAAIFDEVTARLEALGLTGGAAAEGKIDTATAQLETLQALSDTTDEQIVALQDLNTLFGTGIGALNTEIADLRKPLDDQLKQLVSVTGNQERQIIQIGEGLTALTDQLAALNSSMDKISKGDTMRRAQPA